ncbi:D-alanyl-lipoteichoic acid biosynthesis protein DltD, partial [Streptococcus pyogenes]
YLISPQWFVRKGANASAFQNYVSTGQIVDFLQQQTGTSYDRYAAKRFLRLNPDTIFTKMMEKVAKGKTLSSSDKENLVLQAKIFEKVDGFFSQFRFVNHQDDII